MIDTALATPDSRSPHADLAAAMRNVVASPARSASLPGLNARDAVGSPIHDVSVSVGLAVILGRAK